MCGASENMEYPRQDTKPWRVVLTEPLPVARRIRTKPNAVHGNAHNKHYEAPAPYRLSEITCQSGMIRSRLRFWRHGLVLLGLRNNKPLSNQPQMET